MNPGFRVKVTNLPSYASYQDVKKFLQKHLTTVNFRKLKVTGSVAFLTLETEDDVIVSVDLLNDAKFKKNQLRAKRAENEPELKSRGVQALDSQKQQRDQEAKSARQLVTPLADQPYADQLEQKFSASKRLFADLRRQLFAAHGHRVPAEEIVQKVLPSPIIEGYRNKCEFTVGFSGGGEEVKQSIMEGCEDGDKEEDESKAGEDCSNIVVGFISGKMATKQCRVVPADDCPNLSRNTKAVVQHFQQFVRQFGEQPFDEFRRTGFWKMLTVKDFMGDCMLICTVYPHPDSAITEKAKCALIECFLPSELETAPFNFNVTSLYWQEQRNASDERSYEHLAGTPFVYESLLGVSFRISPSTFFQTNSRAAALLYTKIGDLLELPASAAGPSKIEGSENGKLEAVLTENGEGLGEEVEEVVSKKPKMDTKNLAVGEQENAMDEKTNVEAKQQQPIVLLDICCGAGSIGLCLMHRLRSAILGRSFIKSTKQKQQQPFGCIGVELNVEAVRDARLNAAANGFDPKSCIYIDGQAEILFNDLQYHMPSGCSLKESRLLGIIDPPRAGLSDKVVIGCRKLNQLRELVYVSCDPKSATKNLVDLCRPISRKFEGEPFHIVSIHPVDIFPLTEHFEWVVKLQK